TQRSRSLEVVVYSPDWFCKSTPIPDLSVPAARPHPPLSALPGASMVNTETRRRKHEVTDPPKRGIAPMDARKTLADPVRQGLAQEDIRSPDRSLSLSAEQVYHDYAPRVYSVARRMVASDSDAEDVTQDVLLQVIRKLPSFRGESAFPTWLHRVTVN